MNKQQLFQRSFMQGTGFRSFSTNYDILRPTAAVDWIGRLQKEGYGGVFPGINLVSIHEKCFLNYYNGMYDLLNTVRTYYDVALVIYGILHFYFGSFRNVFVS
ncbi:MAG: hypothetical protein ACXVB3_14575 [Flavisolibacter sp.]